MALLEPSTTHSPDMRKSVNDHFHALLGLCWSNGTTFEMQSMRVCLKGVVGKRIRTIPSIALKQCPQKECDNSFKRNYYEVASVASRKTAKQRNMPRKNTAKYSGAAQAFIEQVTARARGWRIMESNIREVEGEPLYVYVHDVGTSYTWMARIEIEGFLSAATSIREQSEEVQKTISAHLANLIGDLVEKRSLLPTTGNLETQKQLVKGKLDEDGPPGLFQLATLHAGTTETVFEYDLLQPGGHFIILRYCTEKDVHLRSLLLPPTTAGTRGVLDGKALASALATIIEFDSENLPQLRIDDI